MKVQKTSSSVPATSSQKKSHSLLEPRTFSVPPKSDTQSSPKPEMPSYSRAAADALYANVMRSMEAKEQRIADVVMPKPESATTSGVAKTGPSQNIGIHRQCSECQGEGKGADEMASVAGVQAKLTVGAVGDQYEQEAERVAAQVMSMPVAPNNYPQVQRFGEEDNPVQRWSLAQSITPVVQRRVDEQVQMPALVQRAFLSGGTQASGDLENHLNASKGGGSVLAPQVRAFMEPRFGADFSGVRVHTGSEAVQMNRELSAQAFTHGSDVYFGAGKSPGNNELTAHELTHVVQQVGGGQIQRQPSPAPTPVVFPLNSSAPPSQFPQSESERIISNIHGLWMKEMLERLSALDKTQLKDILNTVDRVPGIDVARTRIAIEAALGIEFSQSSINWLDKNSTPGGFSDQVIELRDFMKPDVFDHSASTLIAKVIQQIQQSYKKANQDNQTNAKDSAKTTSTPVLLAEAQQDIEKLKILSPLAVIQLQAVINAQGYLSMSDTKAHEAVSKAAGLTSDQEWCGGFAATNYIPLQLSTELKGVFWSTPKLLDFFTYQHGYDPYRWIQVGDEYPEVKTYHEKRGSLRKWLTADQIHEGGELDIRPGDIVLQDNRVNLEADHIQMVQSWEPATQTLFTIDGNGGGYQVDNRPIATANKDKPRPDDEKRKAVETATGYRLRPGGSGVVGLGSYNLSAEPTEQEVKEARTKGKKIVRIVGIGRPSLVDFETHPYLRKLPPKGKKP